MSKMFQCYGIGQALIPVLPPPIHFQSAPTVNQTNYEVGQVVYTGVPGNYTFYIYSGVGVWEILESSSGNLSTLTTDDSTVVVPTGGNINLKGAGSITTIGSGSNATVELTGLTNHSVLVGAGTTTITKLTVGTNGQVLIGATGADPAFATLTSSDGSVAFSVGANTLDLTVAAGNDVVKTVTGNTGGALPPTAGNINIVGSGSITVAGAVSTETVQLTGLTDHAVLVGAGTDTITKLAVGTTGQVLTGATGADPAFADLGTNSNLTGLVVGNTNSAFTATTYTAATSYTPAFSLATAGDSAWTYTTQFGHYTQLGSVVYFTASVTWTNFTNTTGSGVWRISLPVAAGALTLPGQIQINGSGVDASAETANLPANLYGKIASGASVCALSIQEGGVGNATSASFDLTVTQVKTSGTLTVSGFYFTA